MPTFAGIEILSPAVIFFMVHVLLFSISAVGLPYALILALNGHGEFAERWVPVLAILFILELIPIFCALRFGLISGMAGMTV
jgi:hypothetical protein